MSEPDPRERDEHGRYIIPDGPPYQITGPLPDDHPHAPGYQFEPVEYDEAVAAERRDLEAKLGGLAWPEDPADYEAAARTALGLPTYTTQPGAFSVEIVPDLRGFDSIDGLEAAWRNGETRLNDGLTPYKPRWHITGQPDEYVARWYHRPVSRDTLLLIASLIALGAILAGIALGYGVIPW